MDANYEKLVVSVDPLNVMTFEVPPLSDELMSRIIAGRDVRTRILDGSMLEQHGNLKPYAETHVEMSFENEEDIVRCVRMLQWSDERMRARNEGDITILWAWQMSWRLKNVVYFSVLWFTKEFFDTKKGSFSDPSHQGYFAQFGMTPSDLVIRHEIFDKDAP